MQTTQLDRGIMLCELFSLVRFPPDEAMMHELKQQVFAFVDERKVDGWSPERVIIAVKQIARDAGLKPSAFVAKADGRLTSRDDLLVEIVGWCIQRYFSTSDH
jgi:hypothetical protein